MVEPTQDKRDQPHTHRSEDVRGGEIILRTRTRKIIFFGGLIGFVLLVFVLSFLGMARG